MFKRRKIKNYFVKNFFSEGDKERVVKEFNNIFKIIFELQKTERTTVDNTAFYQAIEMTRAEVSKRHEGLFIKRARDAETFLVAKERGDPLFFNYLSQALESLVDSADVEEAVILITLDAADELKNKLFKDGTINEDGELV